MKKKLPGINIQWPISQLILSGEKTIETRTYPIPQKYLERELYIIETPGKKGKFEARVIGIVVFEGCFLYKNEKEFYKDYKNHKVDKESIWAWNSSSPKWGWKIKEIISFKSPLPFKGNKGIKFTSQVSL